ncbi:putative Nudix hydrolase [Paenibacillus baekrokdamisoli]|uniref:Putative Nudix hydrolase n=1 Tax=Paenibacillus baekrokdamisoli TaxID=1712516 RepID=A0A3G9JA92_9BACL|nr:NUDIX domain-containing protein [Paenibacillus baekrokdamisoli]MBB3068196.1 isopentenyldiphosphate isomerase [Paenibacillus baekrokdamisoli]BBH22761.1 putative Nudix hydrolase [Paenibacillus baekrokdamisoli]
MKKDLPRIEEEYFDIYDDEGRLTGTASRSEVHAKGYWHRSFHCWLARREDIRKLVMFQLRHADKDTFPRCFDITAAGHLAVGESMRDAAREVHEELGVEISFNELLPFGETRKESAGIAQGIPFIDREISDVFGFVYEGDLTSLKPQVEEVAGVYEAELESMIALFEGKLQQVTAAGVETGQDGKLQHTACIVRASDFVPRPSSYYSEMFRALLKHV